MLTCYIRYRPVSFHGQPIASVDGCISSVQINVSLSRLFLVESWW